VRVQVLDDGERLRDLLLARPDVHAVQVEPSQETLTPQPPPLRGANIGCADVPTVGDGEKAGAATVRFVLDGDEQALRTLLAELVGAGLPIFGFGQDVEGLEDVFLRLTRRLGDAHAEASRGS
jgi:hypothetical protein